MKKIYFIRHAKAVEEGEGSDFEHDLSERDKKNGVFFDFLHSVGGQTVSSNSGEQREGLRLG